MFPWILGAAGLFGLWAIGSSSSSSSSAPTSPTSPAPTSPTSPLAPSGRPPSGGGSNVTPANIHAAVQVALAHETNPANLTTFGNALAVYGDGSDAAALLAKAQSLLAPSPSHTPPPSHAPAAPWPPLPGTSVFTAPTTTVPLTSHVLPWWVNKYLGTRYGSRDTPTLAYVQVAAALALSHETSLTDLLTFASVMVGPESDPQAAELLVYKAGLLASQAHGAPRSIASSAVRAVAPFVKQYASSSTPSMTHIGLAVQKALMTETHPAALQSFASALESTWKDAAGALARRGMMVAGGAQAPIPANVASYGGLDPEAQALFDSGMYPLGPKDLIWWVMKYTGKNYPGPPPTLTDLQNAVSNAFLHEKSAKNLRTFAALVGQVNGATDVADNSSPWGAWDHARSLSTKAALLAQAKTLGG